MRLTYVNHVNVHALLKKAASTAVLTVLHESYPVRIILVNGIYIYYISVHGYIIIIRDKLFA